MPGEPQFHTSMPKLHHAVASSKMIQQAKGPRLAYKPVPFSCMVISGRIACFCDCGTNVTYVRLGGKWCAGAPHIGRLLLSKCVVRFSLPIVMQTAGTAICRLA